MRLRRLRAVLRGLAAQRLRAALILSGVAAGVAAVVVTSALGEGAEGELRRSLETMSGDLLVVRPAQVRRLVARRAVRGQVTSLRVEDFEALRSLPLLRQAAPAVEGGMRVKAGAGSMIATVSGTTAEYLELRRLRLRAGRFLDAEDERLAARVAVLGGRLAATLFGSEDPVGRTVRLRGVPFEVVGVLESRGVLADGSDEDTKLLIPTPTALRRVFNVRWLSAVFVAVADAEGLARAEREIRDLLRARHRLSPDRADDFAVQSQARLVAMQRQLVGALSLLTLGLAGVALLVGGVGILALMLLSVKERSGEIGLRMAVGARPRDILAQFLAEATLLALGGWVAGALTGGLATALLAWGTAWPVGVPGRALVASFAVAAATGAGFGALPARRASRLPPIVALRLGR